MVDTNDIYQRPAYQSSHREVPAASREFAGHRKPVTDWRPNHVLILVNPLTKWDRQCVTPLIATCSPPSRPPSSPFASPALAADDPAPKDAPQGAAVTVLKASKFCFPNLVEAFGIIVPREETMVRPERPGLKVAEILADPGETVTAGQNLARLTLPEGGTTHGHGAGRGLVLSSTAQIGALASPRGEALFSDHRAQRVRPGRDGADAGSAEACRQSAGANQDRRRGRGRGQGSPRRPTVEPNSQLGQVFISITTNRRLFVNSSGRAMIKTGQSCGVSVPLTAVLYGSAGTVVQVVRRARIETKRVEIGLMSGGQVEIREGLAEGDIVVARAGALLREGDPVRPVTAEAEAR